jgi:cell division GTPase FtsZ
VITLDVAGVKTIMKEAGSALMAIGHSMPLLGLPDIVKGIHR